MPAPSSTKNASLASSMQREDEQSRMRMEVLSLPAYRARRDAPEARALLGVAGVLKKQDVAIPHVMNKPNGQYGGRGSIPDWPKGFYASYPGLDFVSEHEPSIWAL